MLRLWHGRSAHIPHGPTWASLKQPHSRRKSDFLSFHAKFVACGHFPYSRASSARPHARGPHKRAPPPLSERELYAAESTRALRVQARGTDVESTRQGKFVVCGHSPRQPGRTSMATQASARHSAKESSTQEETSLRCLECRHTGHTRKACSKLSFRAKLTCLHCCFLQSISFCAPV